MADTPPEELSMTEAASHDPSPETTPIPNADLERFRAIEADHKRLTEFVDTFKESGITTAEDLRTSLGVLKTIRQQAGDKDLTQVFDALINPPPDEPAPRAKPKSPPISENLTQDDLVALITRQVGDAVNKVRQHEAQTQYDEAASTEARLRAKVLQDPRFKEIIGETTFEDAYGGKGSKSARIAAILADHLFFEHGSRNPEGSYRPVTRESEIKDIADEMADLFTALKAATLLEASTEPSSTTETGRPKETSDEEPLSTVDIGDQWIFDEGRRSKEDEAVQKTFEKVFREAVAKGSGLPLSQQ